MINEQQTFAKASKHPAAGHKLIEAHVEREMKQTLASHIVDETDDDMGSTISSYINSIESNGYAYIPQAFSRAEIAEAKGLVQSWFDKTVSEQSERMPRLNRDQAMVYNLQNKEIAFVKMMMGNDTIEAILKHFLNDRWFTSLPPDSPNYILRSFLARSSNHQMPMHIDSFVPYTGSHPFIMQCSILLEDQTEENGCTVIVPGSHRSDRYASQESFNDAVSIEAQAGDLLFWDSRIWHGARENRTSGTRWAMIATFCRWWIKQAFDIPGNIPQEVYDQLTDSQKAVMGYCSVPYDNEQYGIDMKRSYDLLPKRVGDYKI
ncbi:ectoine hydroxylase-related dioxygenase (phytanoyl-CoA dioxygenase family) [Halomonas fontilapidosi]|uniref:Ectoine hydroxylase-related dioxygenase (Phytanoyl-CoA dioxygenase family) n=1 Tax=Halomonas fontilapidosi TaxID=616675 RepID=A0A7W5DMJ8_9GAMM|nr:phytanoyl-CoA dioxygenase family protein [Halomonas fontilapidosi]MBB3185667.1 ectoine hydroxylase-related dioxygenase (phytanoyl-CoA dioxygenase family) [Halomonas fontilapidosi]